MRIVKSSLFSKEQNKSLASLTSCTTSDQHLLGQLESYNMRSEQRSTEPAVFASFKNESKEKSLLISLLLVLPKKSCGN